MGKGKVVAVHIAPVPHGSMQPAEQVRAIAGAGLEGDHHTRKPKPGAGRELTLIETEALAALEREYGIVLSPQESRRNLATEGVALNHFVGRQFQVGEVRAIGIELCEPCSHLAKLTGKKVKPGLTHRGGLRAEILQGGVIRTGDEVEALPLPNLVTSH